MDDPPPVTVAIVSLVNLPFDALKQVIQVLSKFSSVGPFSLKH